MFDIKTLLILIPALPLAATLVTAVLGRGYCAGGATCPTVTGRGPEFLRVQHPAGVRRCSRADRAAGSEWHVSATSGSDVGATSVAVDPGA